jgi:hypothetical protein
MRASKAGIAVSLARTVLLADAVLLAAACASSPAPGQRLYQRARSYTACMRLHGVPEFPEPRLGKGGTLVYPLNPPAGMLSSADYDAAFRACLKMTVTGGPSAVRYRAVALQALRQAECMRAHGITSYPAPAAINGGLHVPDFTPGLNTHTLRFAAAGRACGLGDLWQAQWWWQAGSLRS